MMPQNINLITLFRNSNKVDGVMLVGATKVVLLCLLFSLPLCQFNFLAAFCAAAHNDDDQNQ